MAKYSRLEAVQIDVEHGQWTQYSVRIRVDVKRTNRHKQYRTAPSRLRRGQLLQRMLADRADWQRFVEMMEGDGWSYRPIGKPYGFPYFAHCAEYDYIPHTGNTYDYRGVRELNIGTIPWRTLLAANQTPLDAVGVE